MQIVIDINELDFEVIKEVNELGGEWKTDIAGKCMKAIANGTPIPKGEWIISKFVDTRRGYLTKCPFCKQDTVGAGNFCPNCGADMRGDKNADSN